MPHTSAESDYERIAQAIAFITQHVESQPTLAQMAAQARLSPFHFQRLFSRWAGVSPKRFLQVLTLERAKQLLREAPRPLLEVADGVGLSSGSRLYDHFVQLEAMTPGEFKHGGAGLTITHGVHDTPFGPAFIAATTKGICRLEFLDTQPDAHPLAELARQWPRARLQEQAQRTRAWVDALFQDMRPAQRPLSLHVTGTNFQIQVWQALLRIPPGSLASYTEVAQAIGRPGSARAVGNAVGANPVAYLIPCHRVIQQSGHLGGYRWGVPRKHALHAWETARVER